MLEWFHFADDHARRLSEQFLGKSQDIQTSSQGSSFPVLPMEE